MPVTTRNATKQAILEGVGSVSRRKAKQTNQSSTLRKCKTQAPADETLKSKRRKHAESSLAQHDADQSSKSDPSGDTITINRAPVLELWSASVSQTLHPELPWETCLSIGSAIATITAISKGRSIGVMEKPDPVEAEARRQRRREKAEKEHLEEVEVMSFRLKLKDGMALVGEKGRKGSEVALRKKFGEEGFERVKKVFEEVLGSWKGKKEELGRRGFEMYERFRPSVPSGQKGWGKKGQLNLQTVRDVVDAG